jgi:hypothetical protein
MKENIAYCLNRIGGVLTLFLHHDANLSTRAICFYVSCILYLTSICARIANGHKQVLEKANRKVRPHDIYV